MNIEYTKSIFDLCSTDDTKSSKYQIQLSYDYPNDNDMVLSIVTQSFKVELIDRYVTEYAFEGGGKQPEFMFFLDHHYDKSTRKNEFLTIVENIVLPQAKEFIEALQLLGDKRHYGIFDSYTNQWLIEQKTFLSISETMQISSTVDAAAADDSGRASMISAQATVPANFYLPLPILFKIHQKFDGVLWEPIDQFIFLSVFDTNNMQKQSGFVVTEPTNFYALLWYMHNFKQQGTYSDFITPLLERYGLSARSFENIRKTRIDINPDDSVKMTKKKDKLRRDIQNCLT